MFNLNFLNNFFEYLFKKGMFDKYFYIQIRNDGKINYTAVVYSFFCKCGFYDEKCVRFDELNDKKEIQVNCRKFVCLAYNIFKSKNIMFFHSKDYLHYDNYLIVFKKEENIDEIINMLMKIRRNNEYKYIVNYLIKYYNIENDPKFLDLMI